MKKMQQKGFKNGFNTLIKMTLTQLSLAVLMTTFAFAGNPKAQDILSKPVSIRLENAELRDALISIINAPSGSDLEGNVRQAIALTDQIRNGVDTNGNKEIEPISGEGGVVTAYQYAYYMADISITP